MDAVRILRKDKMLQGEINLPLSKSISNRALIISALSEGKVDHAPLSEADDTVLLQKLLKQIKEGKNNHIQCENAGTVLRFLAAFLSIESGEWIIDGSERMRKRPIGALVDALIKLGADISYSEQEGYPPLTIKGKDLQGGIVNVVADVSSQYISALMMIAPLLSKGLKINLFGSPASLPYIYMTIRMMRRAGAEIKLDLPEISIAPGAYIKDDLIAETDWSAAAFWYELMALSQDGELFLSELKEESMQGDQLVANYYRMLGVETNYQDDGVLLTKTPINGEHINVDLRDCPDIVPSMIVSTAALGFSGFFHGIENLKHKESDRLISLATELGKCGIHCKQENKVFEFEAQKLTISSPINTYGDHRLAMAFAPLAILGEPITINNPNVVSKSYPGYWEELNKVLDVRF